MSSSFQRYVVAAIGHHHSRVVASPTIMLILKILRS